MRNLTASLLVAVLVLIAGTAHPYLATVTNKTSATIPAYYAVSSDTAMVAVTTLRCIKTAIDTNVAVADSLHNLTLPTTRAHVGIYRIRVRFVAGDAADTNRAVFLYGRDLSGITINPYRKIRFSTLASAVKDTYTDLYMSKVTAVTATGSHANDSVQVLAEMWNPCRTFSDSNQYTTPFLGITQESIPSRHQGIIRMPPDSSYAYTAAAVRAGYFIYPGADAGLGAMAGARVMPDSGFVIGIAPIGTTAAGNVWIRMVTGYWFHR